MIKHQVYNTQVTCTTFCATLVIEHNVMYVSGMCSIAYEPCDENSFKIGPPVFSGENGTSMSKRRCGYFVVVTEMNVMSTQILGRETARWEAAENVRTRL
jgi:hypothetical protein